MAQVKNSYSVNGTLEFFYLPMYLLELNCGEEVYFSNMDQMEARITHLVNKKTKGHGIQKK
jgi:hypothetical protein